MNDLRRMGDRMMEEANIYNTLKFCFIGELRNDLGV